MSTSGVQASRLAGAGHIEVVQAILGRKSHAAGSNRQRRALEHWLRWILPGISLTAQQILEILIAAEVERTDWGAELLALCVCADAYRILTVVCGVVQSFSGKEYINLKESGPVCVMGGDCS